MKDGVATPPQISSNLKFLLKSPLISSKNVDFQETLLKSPQIRKYKIPFWQSHFQIILTN